MHKVSAALLMVLLRYAQAQDANCDFSQSVQIGEQYYVYSPGYPRNYTPGVQCRWIATCPTGYNCRLDCTVITLPQSPLCSVDSLLISGNGDPQLVSAEYYCGRGSVIAISSGNGITAGLNTDRRSSTGGRFYCELTAQLAPTPTPAPSPCTCGYKKLNRIVGGQPTKVNEYPMMAGVVDMELRAIMCGAVIIAQLYLLTAAHCVINKNVDGIAVIVGEHDLTTGSETSVTQIYQVRNIVIHQQYNEFTDDNNIAILRVTTPMQFSESVGPACLPFKFLNTNFTGAKVAILGWGSTEFTGPSSDVLQKVDVDVISQQSCASSLPNANITPRQICTFTPGKDSCQGDSAGPLLFTDQTTGLLFTVGSVGSVGDCASGVPSINTRITAYLGWISANAPSNYCVK